MTGFSGEQIWSLLVFCSEKSFIVGEDFSDTKNRSFKLIGSWWPVSMAVVQKKSIQK
jgi:hypothetical protein